MDASLYRHIIFMNSSVRGPFLPNYFPVSHFPLLSQIGNVLMYIRYDLHAAPWCMWHCDGLSIHVESSGGKSLGRGF